jgi:hypothetical protein
MRFNTPVLFLVFNRPDCTARVFQAIRNLKPMRLYIAADGSRKDKLGENDKVNQVRNIATQVDWDCEVFTLFQENNLGCKMGVSTGITWFFNNEEKGIILEDDCLPHPDFFRFCEKMLEAYHDNHKIWAITGDNFQNRIKRGEASYYFSKYMHVWGWASWRRAWSKYDVNIEFWPSLKKRNLWSEIMDNPEERFYWEKILTKVHHGLIDTWDYQWNATIWNNHGLVVTPNSNLVKNIGFGIEATHTKSGKGDLDIYPLGEIINLLNVEHNLEADRYLFKKHYGNKKTLIFRIFERIISSINAIYKNNI